MRTDSVGSVRVVPSGARDDARLCSTPPKGVLLRFSPREAAASVAEMFALARLLQCLTVVVDLSCSL